MNHLACYLYRELQAMKVIAVDEEVSGKVLQNGANLGLLVPAKALPGTLGPFALERMRNGSPAGATGVYWSVAERQNGNPGQGETFHRAAIVHDVGGDCDQSGIAARPVREIGR